MPPRHDQTLRFESSPQRSGIADGTAAADYQRTLAAALARLGCNVVSNSSLAAFHLPSTTLDSAASGLSLKAFLANALCHSSGCAHEHVMCSCAVVQVLVLQQGIGDIQRSHRARPNRV